MRTYSSQDQCIQQKEGTLYEVIEIAFADARRLLQYKLDDAFGAEFSLKGFDYPWILQSRGWKGADKILDVGAGYSLLPIHIADSYGSEVWAVDDFGIESDDKFWKRKMEPTEHISKYSQVKYVLERLGDIEKSSLPHNYFDCIYSASALEHVPPRMAEKVWNHMDRLLKPGGVMLHAVDMKLPTSRGLLSLIKASLIDLLGFVVPKPYLSENLYYTPKRYLSMISSSLHSRLSVPKWNVGILRMVLDPGIVIEPIDWAYNRIVKDGLTEVALLRVASLLIYLRKTI